MFGVNDRQGGFTIEEIEEESMVLRLWGLMLMAGVPILETLLTLMGHREQFRDAFQKIRDEVREGGSFADGLKLCPDQFSDFVPLVVNYGEETDNLGGLLVAVSSMLGQTAKLLKVGPNIQIEEVNFFRLLGILLRHECPKMRAIIEIQKLKSPRMDSFCDSITEMAYSYSPRNTVAQNVMLVELGEKMGNNGLATACEQIASIRESDIFKRGAKPALPKPMSELRSRLDCQVLSDYHTLLYLTKAGVSMWDSFRTLFDINHESEVYERGKGFLAGGEKLSNAMSCEPKTFPPFVVSMIRAGEEGGGNMATSLECIINYLKWELFRV